MAMFLKVNPTQVTSKPGVSNTRAACGPLESFVRPTTLFGKFQLS